MAFAYGVEVVRLRRPWMASPMNPQRQILGSWDDASELVLEGAYVASTSSSAVPNAARTQIETLKSLYSEDEVDVVAGDRIRVGAHVYDVPAVPAVDVNPFTGWHPPIEIPLKEVAG